MRLESGKAYNIKCVSGPYYFRYNNKQEFIEIGTEPIMPKLNNEGQPVYDTDFIFDLVNQEGQDETWKIKIRSADEYYLGEISLVDDQFILGKDGTGEHNWKITRDPGSPDDNPQFFIQSQYGNTEDWVIRIYNMAGQDEQATIRLDNTGGTTDPDDNGQKWVFTEVPDSASTLVITSAQTEA